jgi:predicted AlkP superfamily phosphohydrolase/phosphomutase
MSRFMRQIVARAQDSQILNKLPEEQIIELAQIVYSENEAFDGEEVSPEHMVKLMETRYQLLGLIPSRN